MKKGNPCGLPCAIAGVVNLRLRDDADGGDIGLSYGRRESSYEVITGPRPAGATWNAPARITRDVSDGDTLTFSAWKGLPLGEDGFVTIAAEYKDQERTERGGYDAREQYPLVAGAFDPRELTFDRFNAWYGEPELDQKTIFINAGYDLAGGAQLYGWASWQDRDARSAGFYRRALDERNTIQIYPDGFLPIIAPQVTDLSAAAGMRLGLGGWDVDSSFVYGKNQMEFTIENTLNRSLGPASKTVFDAGGFDYDQIVYNLSGVRGVEIPWLASPLNVAIGLEARREGFSIFAGEPDSFRNGGVLLPLGAIGCTAPTPAQITAGGRFFINGVDTETEGVDIVMNYPFDTGAGRFDFTLTANFNSTDVTRVPQTAQLAALTPAPVLFDRINVLTFEEGNPENKFSGAVNWSLDRFGATLRATRYGEVLSPGTSAALDFTVPATTLIDLEGRFNITDQIKVAVGADNITDEYPGELPAALNTTGNTPFTNYSPFGRSGRFVYGRISYSF